MEKCKEDISSIKDAKSSIAGATGITTYLKCKMQCNTPFRVVVPYGSKGTAGKHQRKKGLSRGRVSDHLFRKIVAGSAKLNLKDPLHKSLQYVFKLLKDNNVRMIDTQTSVVDKELKVKTNLDGIGIVNNKHVCVFELKTTTHTLADHCLRYNVPCSNRPTLANGIQNTEANMHALQTGFGMMCCQDIIKKPVYGCVVVACTDGAKLYWINNSFTIRELFCKGNKTYLIPARNTRTSKARFLDLPDSKSPIFEQIKTLLTRRGYTDIKSSKTDRYSAIASSKTDKGSFACLVGLVPNTLAAKTEAAHKLMLKQEANKYYKRHKQNVTVNAYLCVPANKTFVLKSATSMLVAE